MADIELNDILRIGAVMTFEGAYEVANVYHVKATAGVPLGFAAGSLDIQEYLDEIMGNLTGLLSDEVQPNNLTLQNVTQNTTFGAFSWGTWSGGTSAAQVTAPGVALFAWARTLKPRVQIRKYYGVFTEDVMTDGLWTGAARTGASNALVDHIDPFTGTEGLQIVGVAYNRTLLTNTEAISVATSEEPAYQRRRKRGRGS